MSFDTELSNIVKYITVFFTIIIYLLTVNDKDFVAICNAQFTTRLVNRTAPHRIRFDDLCQHKLRYCLKGYVTGEVCARMGWGAYKTFKSYCWMDFVNCKEQFEIWRLFHMGYCLPPLKDLNHREYRIDDDVFLDQTYVYPYDI